MPDGILLRRASEGDAETKATYLEAVAENPEAIALREPFSMETERDSLCEHEGCKRTAYAICRVPEDRLLTALVWCTRHARRRSRTFLTPTRTDQIFETLRSASRVIAVVITHASRYVAEMHGRNQELTEMTTKSKAKKTAAKKPAAKKQAAAKVSVAAVKAVRKVATKSKAKAKAKASAKPKAAATSVAKKTAPKSVKAAGVKSKAPAVKKPSSRMSIAPRDIYLPVVPRVAKARAPKTPAPAPVLAAPMTAPMPRRTIAA